MYSFPEMHEVINLKYIKLRSVNKKYISRTFKLNPEYSNFKKLIHYAIKRPKVKIEPPYFVHIYMETYIDIDNPVKAILDSLQNTVIKNDNLVQRLWIDKMPKKKGHLSSLKVFVGTLP